LEETEGWNAYPHVGDCKIWRLARQWACGERCRGHAVKSVLLAGGRSKACTDSYRLPAVMIAPVDSTWTGSELGAHAHLPMTLKLTANGTRLGPECLPS
jgi:hypothetical protein